ncbi:uncharacterized protein [Diadema antillarum]|uniref:uncharacterized protein n=1 Tax=Diadema antillarum TaxID=105358 RepID=UPI003A86F7FF
MAERPTPTHQKLICPLCLELFEKATVLNCEHTFCKKCLKEYDRTHSGWDNMVCPLCRHPTQFDKRRVDGLVADTTMDRIIETAKAVCASNDAKSTCTACAGDMPAVAFCGNCDALLCQACLVGHEQMKALFKNHHVVSMWDMREILSPGRARSGTLSTLRDAKFHQSVGESLSSSLQTLRLRVIKEINLQEDMESMVAMSPDKLVVGYAHKPMADVYSTSGIRSGNLRLGIDKTQCIAFLQDGRPVGSHGKNMNIIRIFNIDGTPTCSQFRCPKGESLCQVAAGQNDVIYVVNGNNKVYLFHEGSDAPQTVLTTGDIEPRQICADFQGTMVVSSCFLSPSKMTVFGIDGQVIGTITASQEDEFLYPAVCSGSKLLVARVKFFSETVELALYGVEGANLVETGRCTPLKLTEIRSPWCRLVSLSNNTLAFGSHRKIYFLKIE